mmetsp:Transcript_6199/g.18481  ORF Transcript_6199/g.18481 Transcript_6199/m.18481 type:complete len:247 (-) Transcript_6199:732-1472(-)
MKTLPKRTPYTSRFWPSVLSWPGGGPQFSSRSSAYGVSSLYSATDIEYATLSVGDAIDASLSWRTASTSPSTSVGSSAPRSYPSAFIVLSASKMEPNTFRYAAVPTLPLSGGNEKTVMATFLSAFFLAERLDHLIARLASVSMRSDCGIERPVTPSRPAKMMGSMAPSSSGSATCSATCTGCRPSSESFHSSKVWKVAGTAQRYGRFSFLSVAMALGWSCVAGPPTSAKPVRLIVVSTTERPLRKK